MLPSVRAWP